MDPIAVAIMAIVVGICVVGFFVKVLLFKSINKAVDNHGRRRHVNNPPREIELTDGSNMPINNEAPRTLRDNAHPPQSQ